VSKTKKLLPKRKRELYLEVIPFAQEIRSKFISENQPIKDTFGLLEQKGFFVLRFPSLDKNLSGFHVVKSNYNCIYINSSDNLGRQHFSAWHEVYHIYSGEGKQVSFKSEISSDENEYKAECFAGCILMPDNLIIKYLNDNNIKLKYLSHKNIIDMQNIFRVSYSAVLKRLEQIFEGYKAGKLWALKNISNRTKLIEKTNNFGGDISLITPTNDFVLPKKFMEDLYYNIDNNRISIDKANEILSFLKESASKTQESVKGSNE
jgi:Zn-dependent peptidase ImmA (M78 family)